MTKKELENAIQEAVSMILNINDNKTIRFGWGSSQETGSAPFFSRNSNVVVIFDTIVDDQISRYRDISYEIEDGDTLSHVDTHIDVHEFLFVCYGPESFNWARDIRNSINMPNISEHLRKNNLFLIPDTPAVQVVPELVDGEWWDRTDLKIRFNEKVRVKKENAVAVAESVNISVITEEKTHKKEDK